MRGRRRSHFEDDASYEDQYYVAPPQQQQPRAGVTLIDLLGKPFLLFIIGGIVTFGIQWAVVGVRVTSVEQYIQDHKNTTVTREELNAVRAELKDTQKSYVTRDQFDQAFSTLQRGVTELRDEIREMARSRR